MNWLNTPHSLVHPPVRPSPLFPYRFLTSFAESLHSSGLLIAAHLCSLLVVWCTSSLPSVSLPLLGHAPFIISDAPASACVSRVSSTWNAPSNEVIQLTEIHQYLMSQFDPVKDAQFDESSSRDSSDVGLVEDPRNPRSSMSQATLHRGFPSYQLLYAHRLLEAGLPKHALNYCVELSKSTSRGALSRGVMETQVTSLMTKLLLEDRSFYAGFILQRNTFSKAFQSWFHDVCR